MSSSSGCAGGWEIRRCGVEQENCTRRIFSGTIHITRRKDGEKTKGGGEKRREDEGGGLRAETSVAKEGRNAGSPPARDTGRPSQRPHSASTGPLYLLLQWMNGEPPTPPRERCGWGLTPRLAAPKGSIRPPKANSVSTSRVVTSRNIHHRRHGKSVALKTCTDSNKQRWLEIN